MPKSLTILRKGLLLFSIPLLVQAVSVGLLVHAQAGNNHGERWAVHTRNVIAKLEEAYRRLLEAHAAIRDRIKADEASDQLDESDRILGQVRSGIDWMLSKEGQLEEDRMERPMRSGRQQLWINLCGGLAILAAALALGLVFLRNLIKRLSVLSENARRLAAGQRLHPSLTGCDEVALVDRAFHEMAASLDEKQQEMQMFVYSVSHDLRSPLVNLQGFSEELTLSYRNLRSLFDEDGVPSQVRQRGSLLLSENIEECIRYIQAAVGRLSRINDSLLLLSRAGRIPYRWQAVDVAAVIGKVVDALHDARAGKGAEITIGDIPPAWGDPTALEQVFANLIANAVQYLDPARPGKIEIDGRPSAAQEPAGFHVYTVKDNGPGIPAAQHHRIFTAFSHPQSEGVQGEGIGLALVRRIVERHGGTIWMESAPGVGTTFFVALIAEPAREFPPVPFEPNAPCQQLAGSSFSWDPNRKAAADG